MTKYREMKIKMKLNLMSPKFNNTVHPIFWGLEVITGWVLDIIGDIVQGIKNNKSIVSKKQRDH